LLKLPSIDSLINDNSIISIHHLEWNGHGDVYDYLQKLSYLNNNAHVS